MTIRYLQLRTVRDQSLHDLHMPVPTRNMQRRLHVPILDIDVATVLDFSQHGVVPVVSRRNMQHGIFFASVLEVGN